MPTLDALENVSARSVQLINISTFRTGTGSISGINEYNRHTSKDGLVLNETPQLSECPGSMSAS